MPIYEYEPVDESCEFCRDGFELLRSFSDEPLTQCPQCHGPVRRVVSAPFVQARPLNPLSPSYLAEKGFTKYEKTADGEYTKTAGVRGPDVLKR